jgi:hypothetical protein
MSSTCLTGVHVSIRGGDSQIRISTGSRRTLLGSTQLDLKLKLIAPAVFEFEVINDAAQLSSEGATVREACRVVRGTYTIDDRAIAHQPGAAGRRKWDNSKEADFSIHPVFTDCARYRQIGFPRSKLLTNRLNESPPYFSAQRRVAIRARRAIKPRFWN